jgi:hypothetical protein
VQVPARAARHCAFPNLAVHLQLGVSPFDTTTVVDAWKRARQPLELRSCLPRCSCGWLPLSKEWHLGASLEMLWMTATPA